MVSKRKSTLIDADITRNVYLPISAAESTLVSENVTFRPLCGVS